MSHLRSDRLSFVEAIGQSVANVSPTFTPAIAVAVVAATAGSATWLVYVLATLSLVVVGYNIGKLASKISAAGSFFIYISRGLNPAAGMLAGWAMLAAYLCTAIAITAATALFIESMLTALGFSVPVPRYALFIATLLLVYIFSVRDVRFSSRVGLVLEALSLLIIGVVCVLSWKAHNFSLDASQNQLKGAHLSTVAQSLVFAIFSYVGFESAATLGQETRNPKETIPKAIIMTPIVAGLVFVLSTYFIVQGFNGDLGKLAASAGPLSDIVPGKSKLLTALVYLGAIASSFACVLASINSFSRILFSLGRYQFVHRSMGNVHAKHQTPHLAVAIGCTINLLACLALSQYSNTDLIGWFGTLASFGFIFVYILCSIAAPALLRRHGEATLVVYTSGAIGCFLMLAALIGSIYPVPAAPLRYLPYGFAAYMLVGFLWFVVMKRRNPGILAGIEQDLEGALVSAE